MQRFTKLDGNQCFYVVPTNIQSMMTGVQHIAQDKTGKATITYTDGNEESKMVDYDIPTKDLFTLVGEIQASRKEA